MSYKFLGLALLAIIALPLSASAQEKKAVKMDVNNDGAVSKAEFMSAQEERFAKMDTNSDLSITEDEYKAAAQKWRAKRMEMKAKSAETKAKPAAEVKAEIVVEE